MNEREFLPSSEIQLADLIDVPSVQSLMEDFHALAQIPMAIIDVKGKVLVGVGWQEICTRFHRVNPDTRQRCIESDIELGHSLRPGEYKLYKCKNQMWDIVSPIYVEDSHVANVFSGQFFLEGERVDEVAFCEQAGRFGFEQTAYLNALRSVPKLSRETVEKAMAFFIKLSRILSELGHGNLQLARALAEQERLTQSLRDSEERLARAQNIAHLGSWELDLLRNRLSWSDEVYRIFGLHPQEVVATYETFLDHVHPEDRAIVDGAYMGSLRGKRDSYEVEHRVVRHNGEIRWVHEKCQHARDEAGNIILSAGMVLDITERRQAEEELRHSEARWHLLSDTAGKLLASENPQSLVNELCCKVMESLDCDVFFNYLVDKQNGRLHLNAYCGISEEEAGDLEWLDFGVAVCGCAARDGTRILVEDVYNTDDPLAELLRRFDIQACCAHPLIAQGGTIGTLTFGTRANPKFTYEQLELMRVIADQVSVAMQRLLSQQALHSLNESLEQRVSAGTAEVRRLAEHLRALAADLTQTEHRERIRMATILHDHIQQLLVGAHMHLRHGLSEIPTQDGRGSLELADGIVLEAVEASRSLTVELCPPVLRDAGLIAGLGWLAQRIRETYGCEVELISDGRAEPKDEDIKLFLFDAVRELIFNACKHSGAKLVHVRLAVEDGTGTRITVEDQGNGFDPGVLQHRDPSSGGFGLFSIQQRLNYLGGRIEIDSAPGKGSRIVMFLPADTAAAAPVEEKGPAETAPILNQTPPAPVRVMVVDDHKVMRDGLSTMLRLEPGLRVIGEAEDGEEAVEKVRSLHPHVILMDVTMPKMDGVEATRIIHQQFPTIKIIGLSMHTDPRISESMKQAGAVAYLTKGDPIEKVIEAIELNVQPIR